MINNITIIIFFLLSVAQLINLALRKITSKTKANQAFLIFSFIILGTMSFFRGDFSTDYNTYKYMFERASNQSLETIFQNTEWGFYLLLKILSLITDNFQVAIGIVGIITLLLYYVVIKKFSWDYYISVIIFLVYDNYLISYNLVRNILAVAICLYAIKYIAKNKIVPFCVLIILASTIHKSAIIFLPMYFILKIDFKKKKNIMMALLIFVLVTLSFASRQFLLIIQSLFGYEYNLTSYGTDGGSLGSFFKTALLFLFIIINIRLLDYRESKQRILINGCFFNLLLQFVSINLFMVQRVGFYFSGCYIILLPFLVKNMNIKRKAVFYVGFFLITLFYCLLFRQEPYYFINHNIY